MSLADRLLERHGEVATAAKGLTRPFTAQDISYLLPHISRTDLNRSLTFLYKRSLITFNRDITRHGRPTIYTHHPFADWGLINRKFSDEKFKLEATLFAQHILHSAFGCYRTLHHLQALNLTPRSINRD